MTFVKHTWNQFVCRKMKMETSCEVKHHLGPDRASAQFWYLDLEHVRTESVTFQEIQAKKARRRSQKKKSHNVFHEETYQVPIKKKTYIDNSTLHLSILTHSPSSLRKHTRFKFHRHVIFLFFANLLPKMRVYVTLLLERSNQPKPEKRTLFVIYIFASFFWIFLPNSLSPRTSFRLIRIRFRVSFWSYQIGLSRLLNPNLRIR